MLEQDEFYRHCFYLKNRQKNIFYINGGTSRSSTKSLLFSRSWMVDFQFCEVSSAPLGLQSPSAWTMPVKSTRLAQLGSTSNFSHLVIWKKKLWYRSSNVIPVVWPPNIFWAGDTTAAVQFRRVAIQVCRTKFVCTITQTPECGALVSVHQVLCWLPIAQCNTKYKKKNATARYKTSSILDKLDMSNDIRPARY